MFHMTTCGFLLHPEAKITKFGDKQASRIGVHTKYFFVRCTRTTNLEAWTPQLERAHQNFYKGDQLWGLSALAKLLGSHKGSLKFSLEHSLAYSIKISESKKRKCKVPCTVSFWFTQLWSENILSFENSLFETIRKDLIRSWNFLLFFFHFLHIVHFICWKVSPRNQQL